MPYNFAADSFHTKKLCSRLSSGEVHFLMEIGRFAFLRPPLGNLGATYGDHLRLIRKHVVDFLLALIQLFSLGVTAEALRTIIGWKSAISLQWESVDPKFQVEGVAPTNHSSSQKTRIYVLLYGVQIWTDLSSILSGIMRVTDGQTDGQTEFSSLYRICITCSAVKNETSRFVLLSHAIDLTGLGLVVFGLGLITFLVSVSISVSHSLVSVLASLF